MIHAYDKTYLNNAKAALGSMLDFAVHKMEHELTEFFDMFLESTISRRFEIGDFRLLAGRSGIEMCFDVLDEYKADYVRKQPSIPVDRSVEYWTGWALAYYQWYRGFSFRKINTFISIGQISNLYSPYHEMDIRQFCDKLDEIYVATNRETNLKHIRLKSGISQSQLSALSGVPVRMIQEYEQGRKNIGKAQAEYLVRLSDVLCCNVKDLL